MEETDIKRIIEGLGTSALGSLVQALYEEVVALRVLCEAQKIEIAQLKKQLNRNSSNSSQPPSQDGFKKQKKTRSQREASGRKAGGQIGHDGECLVALPELEVTQTEFHYPQVSQCDCGQMLNHQQAHALGRRQVHELPQIQLDVINHVQMAVCCSCCGRIYQGDYPDHVTEAVQYGERVKALVILLNQQHMVPVLRTQELLADITGRTISTGTIVNWTQALADQLSPWMADLKQALIKANRVHCDETGIRVDGKNAWVHTVATPSAAIYHVHPKRGWEAVDDLGILPKLKAEAVCIHDCWSTYFRLNADHALCNAHILRELTSIIQNNPPQAIWAQPMAELLKETLHACYLAQEQLLTQLPQQAITSFTERYMVLVEQGLSLNPFNTARPEGYRGKSKQSTEFNLLTRLKEYAHYVQHFATDFTVPFTNNLAEQTLRMIKVKMKVSGTFRSIDGAKQFATIRSYTETIRKQGGNIFDALIHAFLGTPVAIPSD